MALNSDYREGIDSLVGLRYLVVDDQKFSRQIVAEMLGLSRAGHIAHAENGAEALEVLQSAAMASKQLAEVAAAVPGGPDLPGEAAIDKNIECVIADLNMAPVNGLELLKNIRTGKAGCARDLPVVMLTGFSDDHLIAAALALDVGAFVLKPASRDDLMEKINMVLMRPAPVRQPEVYEAIELPELATPGDADAVADKDPKDARRPPPSGPADGPGAVALDALEPGAVLDDDLVGPSGIMLLENGTELTEALIQRLHELRQIGWIPDMIQVKQN